MKKSFGRVIRKIRPRREQPPSSLADPAPPTVENPEATPPVAEPPAHVVAVLEEASRRSEPAEAPPLPPGSGAYLVWMKGLWNQASTLITLLGLLAYLLGRVMVDGFYGQLHTTAEAAGVGYAAILEPAAIAMAVASFIWIGIVTAINSLPVSRKWKQIISGIVFGVIIGGSGGLALTSNILPFDLTDTLTTFLLTGAIPAIRTLLSRIRGTSAADTAESRSSTSDAPNGPSPDSYPWVRPTVATVVSVLFIGGLFFGAHLFGVREGTKAADGNPVNAAYFWLDIPSISATVVSVQPITPSAAFKQLTSRNCWLEIGSGPSGVLLYDPTDKATLTVSADQIVIASADPSCMKQAVGAEAARLHTRTSHLAARSGDHHPSQVPCSDNKPPFPGWIAWPRPVPARIGPGCCTESRRPNSRSPRLSPDRTASTSPPSASRSARRSISPGVRPGGLGFAVIGLRYAATWSPG